MTTKQVTVFAPATVANLGSGYDVFGVAIHAPGDIVVAERTKEEGLTFSVQSKKKTVPSTTKNVAAHVATLLLEEVRPPFGVRMVLNKLMPVGSGLGSSAASSVASVVAVNELLPKQLKRRDLLRFAVEGERLASGSPHADNVAPSLLGGVCLIRSYNPLDVVQIPMKKSPVWVVVHPHVIVRTEEARNILPKQIPLRQAVHQWGNVSGLTVGLMDGDIKLIGKCVEDVIVEPVRSKLIPAFDEVKQAALESGATGCSISGSGPSMFAVAYSIKQAKEIGKAMSNEFRKVAGVKSEIYISITNVEGATMMKVQNG
ncbi:MAG: homoserine kinase [Ignavibacteriae bacterium]|nr:homoserine kinase [Ignavibacteriota bacterium]